jgi:hypothetical protein
LAGHEYKQGGDIIAGTPKVYAALVEAFRPHVPEELKGFRTETTRTPQSS